MRRIETIGKHQAHSFHLPSIEVQEFATFPFQELDDSIPCNSDTCVKKASDIVPS